MGSRDSAAKRAVSLPFETRASGSTGWSSAGAMAASSWLKQLGLTPPVGLRWHVEIALDVIDAPAPSEFDEAIASRFHIDIYSEEWGLFFCHRGKSSWIRVTDIAFVHGRDEHKLLAITPSLRDVGQLLRKLESQYGLSFKRQHALVKTNLTGAEPAIRSWIAKL